MAMMVAPKSTKGFFHKAHLICKFVYIREEGDIEIWCKSKEEAILTMRQHGFTQINEKQLFNMGNGIPRVSS